MTQLGQFSSTLLSARSDNLSHRLAAKLLKYWKQRQRNQTVEQLTEEQIKDCGLEAYRAAKPTIEVSKALFRDFMFMR